MQEAILSNDVKKLTEALKGKDVNAVDEEGYTPLFYACMKQSVEPSIITEILAKGAAVDAKGTDGETPLYIAVFNRRLDVCRLLASKGADVNMANGQRKETALHLAARLGYGEILSWLIESRAEKNARNAKQETPLFVAAKNGRHDTAYILLGAGANATIGNMDGKAPLYIASEKGYKHVVLVLKASPADLKHAKAAADAELRNHPMPMSSTASIVDRAEHDDGFKENVRQRAMLPTFEASKSPMEVVDIKIPEPKANSLMPELGSSGPCRSLEEVGYQGPPPVPKELQGRPPAKPQRIGGTSMVVGTGTEEGGKVPFRVDISADSSMEFYVAPKRN